MSGTAVRALVFLLLATACVDVPTPVGKAGQLWKCTSVLVCGGVEDESTRETKLICGVYADYEPAAEIAVAECQATYGCAAEHWCHADCTPTFESCLY